MNTLEHSILYKLIVLYILDHTTSEITKSQISDFVLERGYIDFITLQLAFSELEENALTESRQINNRTLLTITKEGHHTISSLEERIAYPIRQDIKNYLSSHHFSMQKALSVQSHYRALNNKSYEARLVIKDQQEELAGLTLNLPTKELAETVCRNWDKKNNDIYKYLMHELLTSSDV
ncbi:MAG: DUF4364 family protein [Lachnospiraceae bacterium]|nr:DUF4364 family protein [Lachnospiraceae bacterium]